MMSLPTTAARRPEDPAASALVISYLTLRRAVGFLGVVFPVVLSVGCWLRGGCPSLEDSISAYYGTPMRDEFVGILFAIALFMFSYTGYDCKDEVAGKLACGFAVGAALFPVTGSLTWVRWAHSAFAALLFLTFSYFQLCLFTKTDATKPRTKQKTSRNRVYVTCGAAMLTFIALIGLYYAFGTDTWIARLDPVFWLETFTLWAFGISWGVKGQVILRDRA